MTLPQRKARELAQRKLEILTVAERLFARKGFFKTSMAEIAQEAEFSVGSLYQFFPSKDAVYVALMENKFAEYLALVQREAAGGKTVFDQLDALIATKFGFFEKHRNFFRIYVTEWGVGECSVKGALGQRISGLREEYLALLTRTMAAGIRRRVFQKLDAREMAHLFDGMMNAIIHQWIVSAGEESLVAKADAIRDVFLRGVLVAQPVGAKMRGR
ncbi:MAG: TetR/AcrR family transcriptional regulator [Nitrospirota bacterium]